MSQETIDLYTGILDRDIAEKIMLTQEAGETPIYSMLLAAGARAPTGNEKFEWQTDKFATRRTAINNGGTAYTGATTALVVDDATVFYANCLVYAEATGEVMLCTAVNTGTNTITVVRGLGGVVAGSASSVADNANLLNVGSAEGEGNASPEARRTARTNASNWVQTFRHAVDLSGRLNRMNEKVEDVRAYERQKMLREHGRDIENMLIHGAASGTASDANGKKVTTSGGFLQAITTHVTNMGGAMTQTGFDAWAEEVFDQGSGRKIVFAGKTALNAVGTLHKGTVQTRPGDSLLGLNVQQILTNYGQMNFVYNRRMGPGNAGTMIAVDIDSVKLRFTNGGDTHLKENIQAPDVDGTKDEWFSEFGLEFGNEADHAVAKGITGAG